MKNPLTFLVLVLFVIGCFLFGEFIQKNNEKYPKYTVADTIYIHDTIVDSTLITTQAVKIRNLEFALLNVTPDTVYIQSNQVTLENYYNGRRIEKIKYYIAICENRPVNKKFFYGWIKRTLRE